MSVAIERLDRKAWSQSSLWRLTEIPEPPETLYYQGTLPSVDCTLISVVGSRQYTRYGREVTESLIAGLRNYNIGIISGLALGIDGLAHHAALDNNLYTLAIPGSGLDSSVLYPARHRRLATRILENGGALISELSPTTRAAKWTFPQRNRIMAGLTEATLIIEAADRSGSLITARLATDYNREVLAVPGSIFSTQSVGTNRYIALGATPVTCSADIVEHLGLTPQTTPLPTPNLSPEQQTILTTLIEPMDLDTLATKTNYPNAALQPLLMQLELQGHIYVAAGLYHRKI